MMKIFTKISCGLLLGAALCASLNAQEKYEGFNAATAAEFFKNAKNLSESSKQYRQKAFDLYAAKDWQNASAALCASKFFELKEKFGQSAPNEMCAFILADTELLEDFTTTLSPKDNQPKVFEILTQIWQIDSGASFSKLPRLAIAIAVVFDTPPYANWPHTQVSADILPRELPDPVDTFKSWIERQKKRDLIIAPEKLEIDELKYAVATLATPEDVEWAQKNVKINTSGFDRLYQSVPYATARVENKAFNWSGNDYRLKTIRATGGICTDQAYFTTESAKAFGIPAFILSGAGATDFHAWAACMQRPGVWNFDIGRYEGARFVTGHTIDPQTWDYATDHSLESLRERFRRFPKYRINEMHTKFAAAFLEDDNPDACWQAATEAIRADSRNLASWNVILKCANAQKKPEQQICALYESAIKAFVRYPDIDADIRRELIKRHKTNGNPEAARKLSSTMIIKMKSTRPDIAMAFARSELEEDIAANSAPKLYASYKRLLSMFKKDPAMTVSGIVIPIANKLLNAKKAEATEELMKVTKQILRPEKNSLLAANLASIESQLAAIRNSEEE